MVLISDKLKQAKHYIAKYLAFAWTLILAQETSVVKKMLHNICRCFDQNAKKLSGGMPAVV
jgi:hypothetical protein